MKTDFPLDTYFRAIKNRQLLTAEQEVSASRRVIRDNDSAAREKLLTSNLRLVVKIAHAFIHRGMDFEDLIAEGNVGLIRAVERFNPELKVRFSTYASWWIKQAIRRSFARFVRPIHVPGKLVRLIRHFEETSDKLQNELDRAPLAAEVAQNMRISVRSLRRIRAGSRALQTTASLRSTGKDGADCGVASPEDNAFTREVETGDGDLLLLRRLVDKIDSRRATVLRMRFGLDNDLPMTLRQIANQMGVVRERVRQIETQALLELKRLFLHHCTEAARREQLSQKCVERPIAYSKAERRQFLFARRRSAASFHASKVVRDFAGTARFRT